MPACGPPALRLPSFLLPRSVTSLPRYGRLNLQQGGSRSGPASPAQTRHIWRAISLNDGRRAKFTRTGRVPSKLIKSLRPSPNQRLHDAIALVPGCEDLFQKPPQNKLNLSYTNVRRLENNGGAQQGKLSERSRWPSQLDTTEDMRRTLQGIVADSIEASLRPQISSEALDAISQLPMSDVAVLQKHGYTVDDAKLWMRILTAYDTRDAAAWILESAQHGVNASLQTRPVPTFVALLTLKRYRIGTEALRDMLLYATLQLEARQNSHLRGSKHRSFSTGDQEAKVSNMFAPTNAASSAETSESAKLLASPKSASSELVQAHSIAMDDASLFILIIRLLRHARSVWPEAIVSIAKLFTQFMDVYVNQPTRLDQATTQKRKARSEFLYNSMLPLLAIPASVGPVQHVDVYQAAQFELLNRMAVSKPAPIALHRRAYRAIVSVQMAMRKTGFEKDWARLKAKSWPPFMEPKIGADELKGPEHGQSRALRAIQRMKEAGYGSGQWEHAAQILAGWDTLQTPTIQTRVQSLQSDLRLFLGRYRKDPYTAVWAARIRTTRTIDEAWACFLDYKDAVRRPSAAVYLLMLEKLHYEDLRKRGLQSLVPEEAQNLYAGDYKEISTPPRSPRELTYVRTQPPTFHELSMELLSDNRMRIGNRDVSFLIKNAISLSNGIKYASLGTECSRKLAKCLEGSVEVKTLSPTDVPYTILSAFLYLLCKFPSDRSTPASAFAHQDVAAGDDSLVAHMLPVELAIRILQHCRPVSRPPWHTVMGMITISNKKRTTKGVTLNYRAVKGWAQTMDTIGLGTDFETLRLLCRVLGQAVQADRSRAELDSSQTSSPSGGDHVKNTDQGANPRLINFIEEGEFIKGWFRLLVSGRLGPSRLDKLSNHRTTTQMFGGSMPSLLQTPPSSALHQYVRALGYLQDWSGLLDLAHWIFKYRKDLIVHNSRRHNGMRLLRKTMVALRACLEGHLGAVEARDDIPKDALLSVQDLLRQPAVTAFGNNQLAGADEQLEVFGWPSDEEVAEYVGQETREPSDLRWFEN